MSQGSEDSDGPTRRQLLGLLGAGGITALGTALIVTGASLSPTMNDDDNESSGDGDGETPDEPSVLSVAWDATYGDGPSAFTAAVGAPGATPAASGGETGRRSAGQNATAVNGTDGTNGTAGNESSVDGSGNEGADAVVLGGVRAGGQPSGAGWVVGIEGPETTTFETAVGPERGDGGGRETFDSVETVIPSGEGWLVVGWTHVASPSDDDAPDSKYPWAATVGPEGTVQWRRSYVRSGVESHRDVFHDGVRTADGGYVLAGVTLGAAFDDTRRGDGWLARIGPEGELAWQETYAPGGTDHASWSQDEQYDEFTTIRSIDGGYLLAGAATPSGSSDAQPSDGWLVAVGSDGTRQWSSTYEFAGSNDSDTTDLSIADVRSTGDGYLAVGTAGSYEYVRSLRENHLVGDGWIAGLDAEGSVRWERSVAGASLRTMASAGETGWIVAGDREGQPWVGLIDGGGELIEGMTLHETDGVVSTATVRDDGAIVLAGRRDDGETPVAFVTQLSPIGGGGSADGGGDDGGGDGGGSGGGGSDGGTNGGGGNDGTNGEGSEDGEGGA